EFKRFLEQTPTISFKLIMALCSRLRQTTELLEDSLFLNLPERLAKKILILAETHGVEKQGTIFIDLKLSQTELGSCVNSSRESINKLLKEWKKSDIINFKNGYITIKDIGILNDIQA
ncbi:MAG: Crp/Fnr family transcriptional regulator, partial [Methylococcales bacterium]|nr:Crp/Fnr family transcriptional regulator [Methylococcales bacterium]